MAAAWRGETGWRTIAFGPRDPGQALLGGEWTVGPPGAGRETISGATDDACVVGEPGGWLFFAARGTCIAPGELIVAEGGRFIAVPGREDSRPEVLATGDTPDFGFVLHHPPSDVAELHGPGTEALGLARRADAFTARGGKRPTAVIAKAAGSSLLAGAHLFPLSGSRTAIWGGLGKEVVIVDGALARVDAMGPSTRLLRPFGRFEASAKSTFDQVRYFAVLFGAPLWLLALAALRRGGDRKCLRRVALGYVLILLVGAGGFVEIVGWI